MDLCCKAEKVLMNAYQDVLGNSVSETPYSEFIDYVFDNTHLTYKYISFTALLAKATDESLNPGFVNSFV